MQQTEVSPRLAIRMLERSARARDDFQVSAFSGTVLAQMTR
jgi:hypothetical protein